MNVKQMQLCANTIDDYVDILISCIFDTHMTNREIEVYLSGFLKIKEVTKSILLECTKEE